MLGLYESAFGLITWGNIVMLIIGALLIYLGIAKKIEPLLLVPIGFGIFMVNLPIAGIMVYNPITKEKAIINFKVETQTFNSEIDNTITTKTGLSDNADIQFETTKEYIVKAMLSTQPEVVFKESLENKATQIEVLAPETTLFSKGYLKLYDELK